MTDFQWVALICALWSGSILALLLFLLWLHGREAGRAERAGPQTATPAPEPYDQKKEDDLWLDR